MSRYMAIRFIGTVKKEFRDIFEPIALRGEWANSPDPVLRAFGEENYNAGDIPLAGSPFAIKQWEADPWPRFYDPISGKWIFQCEVNMHHYPTVDWEDDIIPYCMESVELYECWIEPTDHEADPYSTVLMEYRDGRFRLLPKDEDEPDEKWAVDVTVTVSTNTMEKAGDFASSIGTTPENMCYKFLWWIGKCPAEAKSWLGEVESMDNEMPF